jgi:hypothetical protein
MTFLTAAAAGSLILLLKFRHTRSHWRHSLANSLPIDTEHTLDYRPRIAIYTTNSGHYRHNAAKFGQHNRLARFWHLLRLRFVIIDEAECYRHHYGFASTIHHHTTYSISLSPLFAYRQSFDISMKCQQHIRRIEYYFLIFWRLSFDL